MTHWQVIEISREGTETVCDEINWNDRHEAEHEKRMQERTATQCFPHLGYRYEVREVAA